jgi:hypothetical protein
MTYNPSITNFTASYSPDDECWLVHEVSRAFSFAMVPAKNEAYFDDRATALDQVRRLHAWQRKGNKVELRNVETPGRFEAVADTKYGCAW